MKRLCWASGPSDSPTYAAMAYCSLPKGHDGPHGWEKYLDGTVPAFVEDPRETVRKAGYNPPHE